MPVLEKKAVLINCAECGGEIQKGMDKCPVDGSTKIKKSLVVVSKDEDDEPIDIEDLDEEDLEDEADEDDDEDLEDEEDEDDEDEDEDEDEEEEASELTPVGKRAMSVEVMNLSTALAERVSKIFKRGGKPAQIQKSYEKVMTEFNGVMDVAANSYLLGSSISKSSEIGGQASLIQKRVARVIAKEGKTMPTSKKKVRPEDMKFDELPDSVKAYITDLEGPPDDEVEKRAKIFKGLSPEAAAIVAKAAETNEQNEAAKYMEIAKSFEYVPGERDVLAKTLRTLAETDEAAYKNMIDTLTATNENLSQSSIFKSYGSAGAGGSEEEIKKKQAEDLVAKGTYATVEQAQVAMMNGASYKPTA